MKKAQVLGVLVVAGALGMVVSGNAMAVEKPSMSTVKNATEEARKVAADARAAGETEYAEYLEGWVKTGEGVQRAYDVFPAEDVAELVSALSDGAFVTRLAIRTSSASSQVVDGALYPEPRTAGTVTTNAKKTTGSSTTTSVKVGFEPSAAPSVAAVATSAEVAEKTDAVSVESSAQASTAVTVATASVAQKATVAPKTVETTAGVANTAKTATQALAKPNQEKVVLAATEPVEEQSPASDAGTEQSETAVAVVSTEKSSASMVGVLAIAAAVMAVVALVARKLASKAEA